MYVNVTNLLKFLQELEGRFDPMKQWVGRYGCHWYGMDYPHGSTGHLFSNFAVQGFVQNVPIFDECPARWNEDLCTGFVINKLAIPFHEGCSTQFIITFPRSIKQIRGPVQCPEFQFYGRRSHIRLPPTPISTAVTIHMHAMDMGGWTARLRMAYHLSVAWMRRGSEGVPFFCLPGLVVDVSKRS
jgi:hypothetical protein